MSSNNSKWDDFCERFSREEHMPHEHNGMFYTGSFGGDGEYPITVEIKNGQYKLFDSDLNEIEREIQEIDWEVSEAEKAGYDHFMYKEIQEQPEVIERTISGRLETTSEEIPIKLDEASKYEKIWILLWVHNNVINNVLVVIVFLCFLQAVDVLRRDLTVRAQPLHL